MLRPTGRGRRTSPVTAAGVARGTRCRGRADEAGSGTALGMAIMFPILILVLIAISLLSESGRIDQALQSAADRAARTAALCCRITGGTPDPNDPNAHDPNGAEAVALASLAAAEDAASANRIFCNNDFVGDSRVVFVALDGTDVPSGKDEPIPIGGTVHVFLTCRVPPEVIGGFGFPGLDARRRVEGVAVIDPYRSRW